MLFKIRQSYFLDFQFPYVAHSFSYHYLQYEFISVDQTALKISPLAQDCTVSQLVSQFIPVDQTAFKISPLAQHCSVSTGAMLGGRDSFTNRNKHQYMKYMVIQIVVNHKQQIWRRRIALMLTVPSIYRCLHCGKMNPEESEALASAFILFQQE